MIIHPFLQLLQAVSERGFRSSSCTRLTYTLGAVSFKQVDSTNDALSVKKTRPNSIRSASHTRCSSNLGVLSPPREESGDESRSIPNIKSPTPLKSSLRSISKRIQQLQTGKGPGGDRKDLAFSQSSDPTPAVESPSKPISTHASKRTDRGLTPVKQAMDKLADTHKAVHATDYGLLCDTSTTLSADRQSSKDPSVPSRVYGSPERKLRHKFSCKPDQKTFSAAIPGAKVLSGQSTMRHQPRSSLVDSEPGLVKGTASRHSTGSDTEDEMDYVRTPCHSNSVVAGGQMDGAVDLIASESSCRGSIRDPRDEFERQAIIDNRPSSLPVQDSGFKLQGAQSTKRHDICAQPKKQSRNVPHKQSPKSKIGDRGDVKLGASKVRGLAAIFDSAARTSPFVPTPGGAVQQKRRETTRIVSPYTSNLSPRASLQSVNSVSTPVSFMSHARNSVSASSVTDHSGRKSMIPRLQDFGTTGVSGKTESKSSFDRARCEGPHLPIQTGSSTSTPYRLPTPSRLPVRKNVSATGSPSLTQVDTPLDGFSRASMSPPKLTAQHELRPVGCYSSPILPMTSSHEHKGLPHLSEHSTTSGYSEPLIHSRGSSSFSPSSSRGRGASSLRDQIRSLRQELSSKNEECAQLRLEFQESRKALQVSEIILQEDLERSRADCARWKRRAERAERKIDKFEQLAIRIKDARGSGDDRYGRSEQGEFSFISGPDHIDIGERSSQQRLSARINQSARRAPAESSCDGGSLRVATVDTMSDCSGSTVVRNVNGGCNGGTAALWTYVDELVDLASPGLEDDTRL